MEWLGNVNIWVALFCSIIGSMKSSFEVDADRSCFVRGVDVMIGVICGMALSQHYASQLSIGLNALVAIVGSASGAMALDAFLAILPAMIRRIVRRWLGSSDLT